MTATPMRIFLLVAVSYLVFLAAMTPVRYLQAAFSPHGLLLQGAQGTLWSGQAQHLSAQGIRIDELAWTFSSQSLLTLSPAWTVQGALSGARFSGRVGITPMGALRASNVQFRASLQQLVKLANQPPLPAQGEVELDLLHLEINQAGCLALEGTLRITELDSPFNPLTTGMLPITADLGCSQARIVVKSEADSGRLSADLQASITPAGAYQVQLVASTDDTALRHQLQSLGLRPDKGGKLTMNQKGMLEH